MHERAHHRSSATSQGTAHRNEPAVTGSEDPARTGPFPPSAGGHALPAHLTDSTRVATGRRRSGPLLGVLGVVVVAAVLATAQLTASFGYDRAAGQLAQAAAAATSAKAAVGDENAGLETIVGAAQRAEPHRNAGQPRRTRHAVGGRNRGGTHGRRYRRGPRPGDLRRRGEAGLVLGALRGDAGAGCGARPRR